MVDWIDVRTTDDFDLRADDRGVSGLYGRFLKRTFDCAAVIAAAPVILPFLAIVAAAVWMEGGRPFFRQARVGLGGRTFMCWKIRTMVPDAEGQLQKYLEANPEAKAEWDCKQKLSKDPRITWLGRFLRVSSIDELPQLLNVLKGDMSLVGPRPMMPDQMSLYPGQAYYRLRPGITGFWQVSGRSSSAFAARAVHDTAYANRLSFGTDIRVLFKTVKVVLRGTGC